MRILILGGTRYFGRRLALKLLEAGHEVTVGTRGRADPRFDRRLKNFEVERDSLDSMRAAFSGSGAWDVIYDQICYSPSAAQYACEVFKGKVGRYVHTSTQSIYEGEGLLKEEQFDPWKYPIRMGHRAEFEYGEGKRQAEAVFFQRAEFPVCAMRIPIVLGPDDYTGRLEFHIDRVRQGKPIYLSNPFAEACFISSEEAAGFLFWLKDQTALREPINACSNGKIPILEVLSLVEKAVDKKAAYVTRGAPEDHSPFVDDSASYLDNSKARALGFKFRDLGGWLPALIKEMAAR